MKPLLTLSYFVNLVLVGTIGWLFLRGDVAEMKPVDVEPEAVTVSEEIIAESERAEDSEEGVEKAQIDRPNLNELDTWEQVAALTTEGWSEEDAKMYALGSASLHGYAKAFKLMGDGERYWEDTDMLAAYVENERTFTEMQRTMEAVSEELFGRDPHSSVYGFGSIPEEKRNAVALIEQDYKAMQMKLYQNQKGIYLPEYQEALALLKEGKQQDLKALLTLEELFEFQIRNESSRAYQLRTQLGWVDATEEEFREVFRANQAEESEGKGERIREILGEDRYQTYKRSQDWGYRSLVRITERLDLPRERVDEVFDVKESTETHRETLQTKADLSDADRQAAFKTLKRETEEEIKSLLGEKGMKTYREFGGFWLFDL